MPEWITVRTPEDGGVATSRAPFDPMTTDALVRAARSVRPGPSRGSPQAKSSVYVVLLELPTGENRLYVGRTNRTPEERYLSHKVGHKDANRVRKYGVGLVPSLYKHLNPLGYDASYIAEVALAEALRGTGVRVHQA